MHQNIKRICVSVFSIVLLFDNMFAYAVTPQPSAPMEEITLNELITSFIDENTDEFKPFNSDVWGIGLDDSVAAETTNDDDIVSINGHIGASPSIQYVLSDAEDVVFTTSYDFFDNEGLFTCNARAVLQNRDQDNIDSCLSILLKGVAEVLGEEDSTGHTVMDDTWKNGDYQRIWLGAEQTFLRVHIFTFMDSVFFDIDTGLTAFFPNLLSDHDES